MSDDDIAVVRVIVADQATLLDRLLPDWWQQINCRELNQGDGKLCVLGQLFGDYDIGVNTLFGRDGWMGLIRNGFAGTDLAEERRWNAGQETAAWQLEISRRNVQQMKATYVPVEPEHNYTQLQLSDGRYISVPTEWVDRIYIEQVSSGSQLQRIRIEWERGS